MSFEIEGVSNMKSFLFWINMLVRRVSDCWYNRNKLTLPKLRQSIVPECIYIVSIKIEIT